MPTSIPGLDPDRASRLDALVAECGPLSSIAGMEAVQELLSSRAVGVMDSIIITRELLGAGPTALRDAKAIVLSSPSRSTERQVHQELAEELLNALAQAADSH